MRGELMRFLKKFLRDHKGDLSLSVNAIVVFVLAFAMLGVGLFVTNLLRESIGDVVPTVIQPDQIGTPPDTLTPVVFSTSGDKITLEYAKDARLRMGIYNKFSVA